MTSEQRKKIDMMCHKHHYCFIVQGHFHSRTNDRRIERFVEERDPHEYEIVRLSADLTYVFWTPKTP